MAYRGPSHDEAKGVDRIAGVWNENDVAGRGDRLREVGETLLRSQRDNDFALGVEFDVETAPVICGAGAPQSRDSTRYRISMGPRVLHGFDEFGDDVRRGRTIGIAHAEIDNVAPGGPRLGLQRIDLAEDIRGKALDAIEVFGHDAFGSRERPF